MNWEFIIPGKAVAQGRPRFTTRPYPHAVDPRPSREYKARIQQLAMALPERPDAPLTGPVMLIVHEYRGVPKSWSKKRRKEALENGYAVAKPDLDNVVKTVMDALIGVFWADDNQVCFILALKAYAEEPGVYVCVNELGKIATAIKAITTGGAA